MSILNFLRKDKTDNRSAEKILAYVLDHLPDIHHNSLHFKDAKEYLDHREWGIALDSIIELASDSDHYFSAEHWNQLSLAATKMELDNVATFCKNQIKLTRSEIDWEILFGTTIIKHANDNYSHFTAELIKDEWTTKRLKKHKIDKIGTTDGIHFKPDGRSGFIYYTSQGRTAEFEWELGMNGLILWFDSVKHWNHPRKTEITPTEKESIKKEIIKWSKCKGHAIDFS